LRRRSGVATPRIGIAVHRLTRLFLSEPTTRMTPQEVAAVTGLDAAEARIVVDALKDAGFLVEREDGSVGCYPHSTA
jgi:hypothetical protein